MIHLHIATTYCYDMMLHKLVNPDNSHLCGDPQLYNSSRQNSSTEEGPPWCILWTQAAWRISLRRAETPWASLLELKPNKAIPYRWYKKRVSENEKGSFSFSETNKAWFSEVIDFHFYAGLRRLYTYIYRRYYPNVITLTLWYKSFRLFSLHKCCYNLRN